MCNQQQFIAMNKAVASACAYDRKTALEQLMKIEDWKNYYLYHTCIGEVYYKLNNKTEAEKFYQKALKLTTRTTIDHGKN